MSFAVDRAELVGTLHLPDRESRGSALVLHGYGGHAEQPHVVAACAALADAGVAALRFPYRDHQPPRMTLESSLADARAAIRLLRAHPRCDAKRLAVVGFSFGGAVAAVLAGKERPIRALVLAAAPSEWEGRRPPLKEVARTKARVLLLWGARDTLVSTTHADRYVAALSAAGIDHRFATIDGGDHDFSPESARAAMAHAIADWVRESL